MVPQEKSQIETARASATAQVTETIQDADSASALDVSSNIVQEFKARGIAQVIVVLKTPATAGASLIASGVQSDLAKCFVTSPLGRDTAIANAMRRAPRRGSAAAGAALTSTGEPLVSSFRVYENLGVILGTVAPDGLERLRRDNRVASVTGAPELSLIRPRKIAAARAVGGPTWGVSLLQAPQLWSQGLTGKGVVIAHLDTGIDGTHPALQGAIAAFAQIDDLGNQVTPTPSPFDSDEHGTHTAATAVGRMVSGITMGMAPEAQVASALVIEGGNVIARVLSGMNWALAQGAKVLTLSLGLPGWHEDWVPVIQVLRARGVLPVIAVGNEGPGTSRSPGNYAEALSVGAMDQNGAVPSFSSSQRFNRQVNPVVPDLVAPGVDVVSASPGGGFKSMSGTSMATPHVAGLAALLFHAKPGARVDDVEDAIFKSSVLNPGMSPDRAGLGVPNAVRALNVLTGGSIPPLPTASAYAGKLQPKTQKPKKSGAKSLTVTKSANSSAWKRPRKSQRKRKKR